MLLCPHSPLTTPAKQTIGARTYCPNICIYCVFLYGTAFIGFASQKNEDEGSTQAGLKSNILFMWRCLYVVKDPGTFLSLAKKKKLMLQCYG